MSKFTYVGPDNLRPLSPWEYFGYSLLFNLPIAGFILLIVFSVNNDNINRRNFARSYWCIYVLIAVISIIFIIIAIATGLIYDLDDLTYYI